MLRSLLLSTDDKTIRLVGRVFKDLQVEVEHCRESCVALAHAVEIRYDAIIIDDCVEEAQMVLHKLTELPSCNKCVRIVLAEPVGTMSAISNSSAQVILYKPLSPERVRHGLRAVRNLMARDRRRGASRVPTMLAARMSARHARGAGQRVLVADLSESGAAVHCMLSEVPVSGGVSLEFALPGDPELIHVNAELVWQDNQGRAGLRFLDMPSYARRLLAEWLKQHIVAKGSSRPPNAARAGK
jgi:hypothetical protein